MSLLCSQLAVSVMGEFNLSLMSLCTVVGSITPQEVLKFLQKNNRVELFFFD